MKLPVLPGDFVARKRVRRPTRLHHADRASRVTGRSDRFRVVVAIGTAPRPDTGIHHAQDTALGEVDDDHQAFEVLAISSDAAAVVAAHGMHHTPTPLLGQVEVAMVGGAAVHMGEVGDAALPDGLADARIGEGKLLHPLALRTAGHELAPRHFRP